MSTYDISGSLRTTDYLVDYPIKCVSTISSSPPPGLVGKPIFDITGSVKVLNYICFVTGAIENIVVRMSSSYISAPTYTGKSDLCQGGQIGGATGGFMMNMVTGFNPLTSGSGQVVNNVSFISAVSNGSIIFDTSVPASGSLMFHLLYVPIMSGSQVNPRF